MTDKKNPLNQDDWDKLGEGLESDFENIFGSGNPSSAIATVEEEAGQKFSEKENLPRVLDGDKKEKLNNEHRRKIKKLRADISAILERDEFAQYKKIEANKKRLTEYKRSILAQAIKDFARIDEFDPMGSLLEKAARSERAKSILEEIKKNIEKEMKKEAEVEKESLDNSKVELTEDEKMVVLDFFDKDVLPLYEAKKNEKNWNGFNDEVKEFLKEQFFATAEMDTLFLDGDAVKINKAWEIIAINIESKIKNLEDSFKKESQLEEEKREKIDWTLDEVRERLELFGADENDINYFFSLHRKDRMDFLNSDDEDLALRIEKLKETRMAEDLRRNDSEKELWEEELKSLGNNLESNRLAYIRKEDEIGIKISQLKKFFRNFVSIDKNYEIEKELEDYKKDYENSLKKYLEAMVDIEKPKDSEEREIIYRYAQFGEALKMMDAKENLKFEKNPKLENFKKYCGTGTASLLDKYKELLGKPKELIMSKTNSKILGFGGGMIAVGGAMSFAANYIPGLRGLTRTLGIAVATKGFYERAEGRAVLEKEKALSEGAEKLENRLEYINKLGAEVDEAFKKELEIVSKDIPEEIIKEREMVAKRMALSLTKAIAINTIFYELGSFVKGYFHQGDSPESISVPEKVEVKSEDLPNTIKPTDIHGGGLHLKSNPNVLVGKESIEKTMHDLGINFNNEEAAPQEINPNEGAELHRAEIFKEMGVKDLDADVVRDASEINSGVSEEMDLNKAGEIKLEIVEGLGIKDSLAKFFIDKSESFTDGKMGWDADKYSSVEEWADKRAVGIVNELKVQYPNYDFDKISAETSISIDVSDKSDIKISGINDPYHLGGDKEVIDELKMGESKENTESIMTEQEKESLKQSISVEAKRMTTNEMSIAYATGVAADEYARVNDLTVAEFLKDESESTAKLREVLQTLNEQQIIESSSVSVSGALRNIGEDEFVRIFGEKNLDGFKYEEYLGGILKKELIEMMQFDSKQRFVFEALLKVKGENITNLDNEVFQSFKESMREKLGVIEVNNDATVGSYVLKTIKKAYEMGEIDNFKLALSRIKL